MRCDEEPALCLLSALPKAKDRDGWEDRDWHSSAETPAFSSMSWSGDQIASRQSKSTKQALSITLISHPHLPLPLIPPAQSLSLIPILTPTPTPMGKPILTSLQPPS
jgi:hypothetical protein